MWQKLLLKHEILVSTSNFSLGIEFKKFIFKEDLELLHPC